MTISQLIAEKLDALPPDKQQEVLDFVEFLQRKATMTNGSEPRAEERSALAAAQKWAGYIEGGPEDLSTNPQYMEGYGT